MNSEHANLAFLAAVRRMKLESGCGLPYAAYYGRQTHEGWLYDTDSYNALFEQVWTRVRRLVALKEFPGPVEAIKQGLCDPIRLFVKPEPHKIEKIQQKRFRLIASVSLADQLVARLLFQEQNEKQLANCWEIPSKPGVGFSQDQQTERFLAGVAKNAGVEVSQLIRDWKEHVIPTDCSGFDWSVPMWLLEDEMEVRNALTKDCPASLKAARWAWLQCLANSVFVLSSGAMFAQDEPGIQKSGSFNTSSTNSMMRAMLAYHAGARWAVTMGDDAFESPESDLSFYARVGIKCERAEEFDFCSHIFTGPSTCVPKNHQKMVFGLLTGVSPAHDSIAAQLQWWQSFESIAHEMRHMSDEFFRELLLSLDVEASAS